MEDKFAVVMWPNGDWVSLEDFVEEDWYHKSDDYCIEYYTEEELDNM